MKGSALLIGLLMGVYPAAAATLQEPMKTNIINADRKEVGQASITDGPNGVIIGPELARRTAWHSSRTARLSHSRQECKDGHIYPSVYAGGIMQLQS